MVEIKADDPEAEARKAEGATSEHRLITSTPCLTGKDA